MNQPYEIWRTILKPNAPAWVAFEADHCVLLPQPGNNPARTAQHLLAEAPQEGEVAEHPQGYLFITGPVFTLVRRSEATNAHQVAGVALQKRKNREVLHVEFPSAPVKRAADLLLRQAKIDLVEEISLECEENRGHVRFLREGTWTTVAQPPTEFLTQLIEHWRPLGLQSSAGPWGACARLSL